MPPSLSQFRLRYAAHVLAAGGVVSHPTEAVWGLAALPGHAAAVARVLQIKNRDVGKGLLLVADCVERVAPLLEGLPAACREQVRASWPGPVTWVLPDPGVIPAWVRGDHDSVAVRVSDHPLTVALCEAAGSCLVSTSANPTGCAPARQQRHVQRYFRARVDYYLPGATGSRAGPSEIRDALTGAILRPAA